MDLSPQLCVAESSTKVTTLPPVRRLDLGRNPSFSLLPYFFLSFDSFRMAAIIVAVAALSVGLAQLGLWGFGYPMGFIAIVGTMGLVGIAINDAIVVLTALRASADARDGDLEETREIVLGAARHVLATTLTTIGGFLPLIYFGGRFWPPMATAIAGGVMGSSVLALIFVPCTFHWLARRSTVR